MLTTTNYKFKKPELTDSPPDITVMNGNWDIIDTNLKKLNDDKAPKDVATTSKEGLMSRTDKSKLDGIAQGANAYTHPSKHPASIITEDATHRFLTDAERKLIQAWENFKANGGDIGGIIKANFGSLKGANGWKNIGDGMILQWGKFTVNLGGDASNSSKIVQNNFPIRFPTDVINQGAICTYNMSTNDISWTSAINCSCIVNSFENLTVESRVINDLVPYYNYEIRWYAIGY